MILSLFPKKGLWMHLITGKSRCKYAGKSIGESDADFGEKVKNPEGEAQSFSH